MNFEPINKGYTLYYPTLLLHNNPPDHLALPHIIHTHTTPATMPGTTTLSRSPPSSHPRAMSGKPPSKLPVAYPSPYRGSYNSSSPPKPSTSHRHHTPASSAVPSLISDSGSSASARSADMADVDLLDMLDLKLSHSVKAEPLDRGIAKQAQAYVSCLPPAFWLSSREHWADLVTLQVRRTPRQTARA